MATDATYTCGKRHEARCTFYNTSVPTWSSLVNEDCVTLEETTAETYVELNSFRERFDLDNIVADCITFTYADSDNKKMSEVVHAIQDSICALETSITNSGTTAICDVSIATCGLDTDCLDDACGTGLSTVKDVIQALITKVCELETRINAATAFPIP